MKKFLWLFVVVVVVGAGYALLNRGNNTAPQESATPEYSATPELSVTPVVTASASPSVSPSPSASPTAKGPVKTFKVNGGSFYFKPNAITVNKGDTVKIEFTNDEGFHDWVIDEFNARTPRIQSGQSATVEFFASKSGSFQYYCSVGSHRANGMWGTLVVK